MCGIVGGNSFNRDYKSALDSIMHRGPDGNEIKRFGNITLGFCRLAIIDLSSAAMQPMSSKDGRIHMVFNGEIYGYKKLRAELSKVYRFETMSDTEVILALYEKYGEKFVDYIDGMFAIVIFDERTERILFYRDRAGIKPLYYFIDSNDDIVFGSELKAIKAMMKDNELKIDNTALYDFFSYGYVPEPKSIYKGVKKLSPATCLIYNVREKKKEKEYEYWKPVLNHRKKQKKNERDICEEYRYLVNKSVGQQLVADVNVGLFYSGGVDSSIIAFEALKSKPCLESYSIGFEYKNISEDEYVREFSKQIGLKNEIEILDLSGLREVNKLYPNWFDEPYDDVTAMPTFLLAKNTVKKTTVALSGDGNDELFGGYYEHAKYYEWEKNGFKNRFEMIVNNTSESKREIEDIESGLLQYANIYGCFPDRYRLIRKSRLGIPEDYDEFWFYRKNWNLKLPALSRIRYADFKTYLLGDILPKTDRSSMAVSLEVRVPFLSRELIEFAFSLSEEDCNPNGELKKMVKESYKGLLPKKLIERKKHGFTVPDEYVDAFKRGSKNIRYSLCREYWNEMLSG